MTVQTAIVHEAEVQRQHARLRIPVKVDVAHQSFDTFDWSVGGFSIESVSPLELGAEPLDVVLYFRFDEFAMILPLQAETRHVSQVGQGHVRTGFEFVNVTRDQVAMLRYVSGAFLSGELVHAGDLFNAVNRDNSAKARKKEPPKPTAAERMSPGRVLTMAAACALVVGVVGLIGMMIYERAYLIPATTAEAAIQGTNVRAPESGIFAFTGAEPGEVLTKGTPMIGIERADGSINYMDSPCDCMVLAINAVPGLFVSAGEPAILIAPPEAKVQVTALFEPDTLSKLDGSEKAHLRFLGSTEDLSGKVSGTQLDKASGLVAVTIDPDQPLPVSMIGKAANVILDRSPSFSGATTQAAVIE